MSQLTALQKVAVAAAIKAPEVNAIKQSLKPGAERVDFTCRVTADVTKAANSPGGSGSTPAVVTLLGPGALTKLMKLLGIGPQRLATAARELCATTLLTKNCPQLTDEEFGTEELLLKTLDAIAKEYSDKLPKVPWNTPGKSGTVTVNATIEVIDTNPPPTAAAEFPRIAKGTERVARKKATAKKATTKRRSA